MTPSAGSSTSPLDRLSALAGTKPKYVHRFVAIGDALPIDQLDTIVDFGATPLLTLEPWRADGGIDQPAYALARIAAGDFDTELRRWGAVLATWGKPLLLRFAQEMNGTWYPWAVCANGNTAADYRAAWQRMRSVIAAAGADKVSYVWAPNVLTLGTTDFTSSYPGADQVDYVAVDGYNWGDVPGHRWQPAPDLFRPSLDALRQLNGQHPLLVTEVGCADGATPDMKANWIRDFFAIVESEPRLAGFLWFQMDKERDWRFNTTAESTDAFRSGVGAIA
ncbi:glycoside hydrolase family 26 protein [Gordonia sp. NPDC003424]